MTVVMAAVEYPHFLGGLFIILAASGLVGHIPDRVARRRRERRAEKSRARS